MPKGLRATGRRTTLRAHVRCAETRFWRCRWPDRPSSRWPERSASSRSSWPPFRADQWTLPTPCEAWTVRELVAHVVAGQQLLVGLLRDEPVPASDDDLLTAYRRSADDLLAAFAEPGALERIVTVPAGTMPAAVALHLRTTEALVHGWDLARATGLPFDVPADLAEAELAFSRPMLDRVPPEKRRFAPSQPVAEDAPALDRLLALLGRTPTTQEAR